MQIKELCLSVLLFLATMVVSICIFTVDVYSKEYINEEWGIEFNYPQWLSLSDSNIVGEDCKDKNQCLLEFKRGSNSNMIYTILIQRGQQFEDKCMCDSLSKFVQYEYRKNFEFLDGFSLVNDNQTTLNGNGNVSAIQMEYELTNEMGDSRHLVIWTKVGDIFYAINYQNIKKDYSMIPEDYSSGLPSFQKFLKSIKFLDNKEKKLPSFMISNEPEKQSQQPIMIDIQKDEKQSQQPTDTISNKPKVIENANNTINNDRLQVIGETSLKVISACNFIQHDSFGDISEAITDTCQKGMAWLKFECDLYYDSLNFCKENRFKIKSFLSEQNLDDIDIKYFHDEYETQIVNNPNSEKLLIGADLP